MIDIKKLTAVMNEVISERGDLILFGLVLREDAPDNWDLVVAGPWMERDKGKSLKYLSRKLIDRLSPGKLLAVSRVVILDPGDPVLEALLKLVSVDQGDVEIRDRDLWGLQIRRAHIIRATRDEKPSRSRRVARG